MSLVDSTAAFGAHVDVIDPGGALKALLDGQGLKTFSQLAFAAGTPQAPVSDEVFKQFASDLNGGTDMTIGNLAKLRRLHFEAQTLVVAHLKSQVSVDSAEGVRKLPAAEKEARLQDQKTRLVGLQIKGETQPSYALVDMVANMAETNNIVWLPPSKCTKRDAEVQVSLKEKPQTVTVENHTLKLATPPTTLKVDIGNELQFQWAMQRRGFAYDQCRLINYETHETWLQILLNNLTKDVPVGFAKVGIEQLLRADKEVFTLMAQELSGSLKARVDGTLPMDEKLKALVYDPRITQHLLPLPKGQSRAADAASSSGDKEDDPVRKVPKPKKKAKASPKAKAKCPEELKSFEQLTSALRDRGFRTMAIDRDKSRSKQVHIVQYDLENPHQLEALLSLLEKERDAVLWVHFAPSCGTASRSRERPLKHLERQGFAVPKPLRSDDHPLGLPGLFGKDLAKVLSANATYRAMLKVCVLCLTLGIAISIENPGNSLFWKIPFIVEFLEKNPGFDAMFHHCVHGGLRDKLTRWWSDRDWFLPLALLCDGQHVHAKWNPEVKDEKIVYPTHEEAAYPMLLCKRLADIAFQQAINLGAIFVDTLQEQIQTSDTTAHRFLINMLPRGKKFKPLVSEYGSYSLVAVKPQENLDYGKVLESFPKGAKIAHRRLFKGKVRVDEETGNKQNRPFETVEEKTDIKVAMILDEQRDQDATWEILSIGVPRDEASFLQKAFEAGHPRSMGMHLSEGIKEMLKRNFEGSQYDLSKGRLDYIRKWAQRAKELASAEEKLQSELPSHLKSILGGKRLLLMKEMLEDASYPDTKLIEDISNGFGISGWLTKSNVFPKETKRPEHDMHTVMLMAKGLNKMILEQVSSQAGTDLAAKTWASTKEELEKGWVFLDDTGNLDGIVLAKRFGLEQKTKLRVIDDCTIGGWNKTCGSSEKLRIHAVDEMVAYLSWTMSEIDPFIAQKIVGKTYDLTSAYKQFGIHARDREVLRIATWNADEHRVALLGVNALPFGATGSVSSFLRISIAIWFLGVQRLSLAWTAFFDDFTLISRQETSNSASFAAEALFKLLGIKFAQEGSKSTVFAKEVKTLGVLLRLDGKDGEVELGHTESRRAELRAVIESILQEGQVLTKTAESLRGRLQWFETFAFGRTANSCLHRLGEISMCSGRSHRLSDDDRSVLSFLKNRVLTAPPILVQPCQLQTWYIFTDGSCESQDGTGGVGGVLMGPDGRLLRHFSSSVPPGVMKVLLSKSDNPIYELELAPVLIAIKLWCSFFRNSQVVMYLDNDAARAGLIKMRGATDIGDIIIQDAALLEAQNSFRPWFGRVPTSSNVADGPSRFDCRFVESHGSVQDVFQWEDICARWSEV
eukprot:symbB.v1.2.032515.t1/scaffold3913.1/size48432/3